MRNFIIKILSLCLIISTALFIGTGCEHKHTYTHYVSNKDATYDADGTKTAICDKEGCDETDIIIDKGSKLLGKGIDYELNADKKSYCVKGIGTCTDIEINIPLTYNDKPVTSIGDSAFYGCSSLKSIIIPNSVTSIGNNAFYGCDSLSYNTKGGLEYLGNNTNKYVYLAKVSSYNITVATIQPGCRFIGEYAFGGCSSLKSITIPNNVLSVGSNAFYNCNELTSVTIYDGLTSIGDSAFYNCNKLISVKIPNSVIRIGNYAFGDCSLLESIIIGDKVMSIGNYAFYNCNKLKGIVFSDISTWYKTIASVDLTNGTEIDLTNPSINADYFKSAYSHYYWYKT